MKRYLLFLLCLIVALLVSCAPEGITGGDNLSLSSLSVYVGDSTAEFDLSMELNHVSKFEIIDEVLDLDDEVRRTFTVEYSVSDVEDGVLAHDAEYYGKHRITLNAFIAGEIVISVSRDVILTAMGYNMACLVATVPVTDFTLIALDGDC